MNIFLIILYLFLFITFPFKSYSIDTKAEQAVVIEFDTNEILFEKNAELSVPPASMTKIMTVYAAFDRIKNTNLAITNTCRISSKAYKMGGSRTFLEIDDSVSIDDLLKGIIIQSGNDASVALAECLGGTEEDFVKLMNVYAERLGMKNTNFYNSSGWPEPNHNSSVKDLAILSNSLIRDFPELYSYFSEKEFTYNDIKQPNRNHLLEIVEGVDGLKTGYTKKSGWGIAATSIRNERRITVVINGTSSSRSRMNEASNLMNWAFNQTSQTILFEKNQVIKNVDIWLGKKPSVNLITDKKIVLTLSFDQLQLLKSKIEYTKPISAPVIKGKEYGKLLIDIQGKSLIKIPLLAANDVKKVNPIFRTFSAIKYLIFGTSLDEKS